jgi:hypothetical protein
MIINNIKMGKFKLKSSISKNRIHENKSNGTKYTGYSKTSNSQSSILYLTNSYDQVHPQYNNMAMKITMQSNMIITGTTRLDTFDRHSCHLSYPRT